MFSSLSTRSDEHAYRPRQQHPYHCHRHEEHSCFSVDVDHKETGIEIGVGQEINKKSNLLHIEFIYTDPPLTHRHAKEGHTLNRANKHPLCWFYQGIAPFTLSQDQITLKQQ